MGFWNNLTSLFAGGQRKGSPDDWWEEFGPSTRSASGEHVNQFTAMQVSTVMACVSILAGDVAKLPLHVYKRMPDGSKQIAAGHPIEKLFQRPNGWQTRFEFIEQLVAALVLRGNAYAPIVRSGRGVPIMLVPVNPDRSWIHEGPGGSVFYQVSRRGPHDMAMLASLPDMVPAEDMLHVRWFSQDNSLWGSSRIGLARQTIGLSLGQQELAGRLIANGAHLGGVLTTEQKLGKEAAERLAKDWAKLKTGAANAGKTAVLEQGLKWQPLSMTAVDAQFLAQREFGVLEIARIFGVPPHKLGVLANVGKSVEQLDQDYYNNVLTGYLERIEAKLNQTFGLDDEELFSEFDISRFLRASLAVRYAAYRTGIVGMFLTPNECRRQEGLPDVEGGDELYQPVNVAPIGFTPQAAGGASGPGSDTTGEPAAGGDGDPSASPDDGNPDSAPQG